MRAKRRGYSLMEIAMALVVLGIVVGGALVPIHAHLQNKKLRQAETHLAAAKQAVQIFAVRYQTEERIIDYDGETETIPPGRPYLPCPDITGDGEEDRFGNGEIPPSTITVFLPPNRLLTLGVCEQHKGLLPWKTLGLQEFDAWGNHLTYRVDLAFSNSLLGFDERSRADIFDYRLSLTVAVNDSERKYQPRNSRDDGGAIICNQFAVDGCPSLAGGLDNLEVGLVVTVALKLGGRHYPPLVTVQTNALPQGIVDGLPVVILSHGKNGRGAMRFDEQQPPSCITVMVVAVAESANAYYDDGHPFGGCYNTAATAADSNRFNENIFIKRPPFAGDAAREFDDIVVYISTQALLGVLLQAGILPIEKLEFHPR